MVGYEHPCRQPKSLPRAHYVEAPCQNREFGRVEWMALWQQLHRHEEEAVGKDQAAQPGHGSSVQTVGGAIKRESQKVAQPKSYNPKNRRPESGGLRYPPPTDQAWAASLRRTHHIGDFVNWKDHDAFRKAFERLLRDLRAPRRDNQGRIPRRAEKTRGSG